MCKFIKQIISTFVPIKTFSDLLMHFGRTGNFIRHISLSLATTRYDIYVYKIIMCSTFICLTFWNYLHMYFEISDFEPAELCLKLSHTAPFTTLRERDGCLFIPLSLSIFIGLFVRV